MVFPQLWEYPGPVAGYSYNPTFTGLNAYNLTTSRYINHALAVGNTTQQAVFNFYGLTGYPPIGPLQPLVLPDLGAVI